MRMAIWVLWPSFIVGGAAETLFFSLFDPMDLHLFGEAAGISRLAVYSAGFFLFWAFAAASSTLTCFLQRGADEINRVPLPAPTPAEDNKKPENPNAYG